MLTNEFITLCSAFAETRDNVLNHKSEDSKKLCRYTIEFYGYILEFRYVKKESVYYKPSSLYCLIALKKNSVVHYHLTDIIPFLEKKTFKSCYFQNIESPERLKKCFESLVSTINDVFSQIPKFLLDDTPLLKSLFESYKIIFKLKDKDIDFKKIDDKDNYAHAFFVSLQNTRDGYLFSRFSSFRPYSLLIKGQTDKALAKYETLSQKGKLLEYEKQLISYINNPENHQFSLLNDDLDSSKLSKKYMSPAAFAKAFILVFLIASLFFCGIFAVHNLLISNTTVFTLSAPWYIGFLCAALCSVFGSIALFSYMPVKNLTKEQKSNLSKLFFQKATKRLSFIAFFLSIVVSIFFEVMIMKENVQFYNDYLKFNSNTYNYNEIDGIYHIDARYNVYGDRIKRSSYVILFKDKISLDFDGYTSVNYTEKYVLPLLKEKTGLQVKNVDSEKQLPGYTE